MTGVRGLSSLRHNFVLEKLQTSAKSEKKEIFICYYLDLQWREDSLYGR